MTGQPHAKDAEEIQRIGRLTPLETVLACIAAQVVPVAPREIAAAMAGGKILAENVVIPVRPTTALALRDGWAVSAVVTHDASPYAPASLASAIRIDAGAAVPLGADAVVEVDAVEVRGSSAETIAPVTAGEGVLAAGGDADGATVSLQEGQHLTAVAAAALAAGGVTSIRIRAPRLLIVSARPPGDPIIDAAARLVTHGIATAGGVPLVQTNIADESRADASLENALSRDDVDAVIVIGGTGSGRNDRSVAVLERLGRVEAHGIALSPGGTAAFGHVEARPVLLLPGRIDGALAAWLLLGQAMLTRLAGSRAETPAVSAKLSRKVASNLGLAEFIPVRLHGGEAEPLAAGYLPLQTLVRADGWLLVAADREGHPAGASVTVRLLP